MNRPHVPSLLLQCAVAAAAAFAMNGADAALGELHRSAPQEDTRMPAATQRRSQADHYEVHEVTLPDGPTVREYVAPGGVVFAVAWSGMAQPELRRVLGAHFWRYLAEAQRVQGESKVLKIYTRELIVHIVRFPRGVSGLAYVPALVPAGVDAQVLR